jgi:hypothetical protein
MKQHGLRLMRLVFGIIFFFLLACWDVSFAGQRISTGGLHTLLVKSDGTLWAWGDNYYGQLWDATMTNRTSPVQIGSDNKWIMASAREHSLVLKSDGTLWAWENNYYGQLGDGTTTNKNSPVRIGGKECLVAFDGDSKADILWQHTDGTLAIWFMDGTTVLPSSGGVAVVPSAWEIMN